jgi:hypothetical protein
MPANGRQPGDEADVRGRKVWEEDGIYASQVDALAAAHPDLPGYVLNHYASIIADPEGHCSTGCGSYRLGSPLTALVAVVAVRATGASEELLPFLDSLVRAVEHVPELKVLGSDDGIAWIIEIVDRIGNLFTNAEEED